MTPEVKYCFETEDVAHVAKNMAELQVRRLPGSRASGSTRRERRPVEGERPRVRLSACARSSNVFGVRSTSTPDGVSPGGVMRTNARLRTLIALAFLVLLLAVAIILLLVPVERTRKTDTASRGVPAHEANPTPSLGPVPPTAAEKAKANPQATKPAR